MRQILVLAAAAAFVGGVACSDNGTSPSGCSLGCDVDTDSYTLSFSCESGDVTKEFLNQTTTYNYDGGVRVGFTLNLNQRWTFHVSGNVYTITGTIVVSEAQNQVTSYDIQVAGGEFGATAATCHS